jgi:hypothetical protein
MHRRPSRIRIRRRSRRSETTETSKGPSQAHRSGVPRGRLGRHHPALTPTSTPAALNRSSPATSGRRRGRRSGSAGRFNLEIGGVIAGDAAAVGDGASAGTVAVSGGSHAVGESAAPGTTLARYDTEIVCLSDASVVAESNAATLTVRVQNEQAIECTIINTCKQELKPVVPVLECVVFKSGVPERAVRGYRNDNAFAAPIPIGSSNSFTPAPEDRGQPTLFEPGRWTGIFALQRRPHAHLDRGRPGRSSVQYVRPLQRNPRTEEVDRPGERSGRLQLLVKRDGARDRRQRQHDRAGHRRSRLRHGQRKRGIRNDPGRLPVDVDCTRTACQSSRSAERRSTERSPTVTWSSAPSPTSACRSLRRLRPTPPAPPGDPVDLAIVKTATPTTVVLGGAITFSSGLARRCLSRPAGRASWRRGSSFPLLRRAAAPRLPGWCRFRARDATGAA